jgi:5-methylcytosine-specific restriction protein B
MADKPISLEEALKTYNRQASKGDVELAEKERKQFVEKFPLSGWPTLPLERYALGLGDNENSYCWWLECLT